MSVRPEAQAPSSYQNDGDINNNIIAMRDYQNTPSSRNSNKTYYPAFLTNATSNTPLSAQINSEYQSIENQQLIDEEEQDDVDHYSNYAALVKSKTNERWRKSCFALLYLMIFCFVVTTCYTLVLLTQSMSCESAPYIYVTHKGSRNIMKFSRDGKL